jgi:tRNA U34 5-methylaminomethyl-2-thiouridine-forming methyltransferase MnmC
MLPIKREITTTADGSVTIFLPEWEESYHSKHGAIQEANHVFIDRGLHFVNLPKLAILEIGFGTGLNALLTLMEGKNKDLSIEYVGVEAFPISENELQALNYIQSLNAPQFQADFDKCHACAWEVSHPIHENFRLTKNQLFFEQITYKNQFDLIYFDAFGYRVQPELWSETIFKIMFEALKPSGVIVTYACRTPIKKAMESAGFKTEKLPGPPGKREMLRGVKN